MSKPKIPSNLAATKAIPGSLMASAKVWLTTSMPPGRPWPLGQQKGPRRKMQLHANDRGKRAIGRQRGTGSPGRFPAEGSRASFGSPLRWAFPWSAMSLPGNGHGRIPEEVWSRSRAVGEVQRTAEGGACDLHPLYVRGIQSLSSCKAQIWFENNGLTRTCVRI